VLKVEGTDASVMRINVFVWIYVTTFKRPDKPSGNALKSL